MTTARPPSRVGTTVSRLPPMIRVRPSSDVVIVGAGPFGLSAAAYLARSDLSLRVFGEPMEAWRRHMPRGMFVRTPWEASHIADPDDACTLDRYMSSLGRSRPERLTLMTFVEYGCWFQARAVPALEKRRVRQIDKSETGFRVTLADGEALMAGRVILATGLKSFANIPRQLRETSPDLVSHVSDHACLDAFAGAKVVVVGAGLSAFEYAIQLQEAGASVEVIMRGDVPAWFAETFQDRRPSTLEHLYHAVSPLVAHLMPRTGFGPLPIAWTIASPGLLQHSPRAFRDALVRYADRAVIDHGSPWFADRLGSITISVGRQIAAVERRAGRVRLKLDDGSELQADHILAATGYRFDITRLDILSPSLRRTIRHERGYPALSPAFESSVPGLHFIGPLSQGSFGPVMHSIAGTQHTGRALLKCTSFISRATR